MVNVEKMMDDRNVHPAGDAGFEWKWIIRARRPDEIDVCVGVLADVHAASGYPMFWPAAPAAWLTPENLLIAWVAEDEHGVIGHVALRGAVGESAAPIWSAATGLPPEAIAAVAKLFIAPSVQGRGLGAALLAEACAEARTRGLRPALEVLDHDQAAIALYERTGWQRVASASAAWGAAAGGQMVVHYYIAPD